MKVHFTPTRGESTEWVFVILRRVEPETYKNDGKGNPILRKGYELYVFQLKAKNGPYAGW
jgi:hypothetical protein